jgi:hypothetical protein
MLLQRADEAAAWRSGVEAVLGGAGFWLAPLPVELRRAAPLQAWPSQADGVHEACAAQAMAEEPLARRVGVGWRESPSREGGPGKA